ncbi:hypothetical protein ACFWMQ_15900 [Streptomyces sp. NPDC058372]|uniref:hypothetical protein n=1 Tax=Streptomyces sp. NPDC058372 TaxID=3346464 RepID=UPI00365D9043
MTTTATPPAAALDVLLNRLSAGKPLTPAEADLFRAGVTGLRRTAAGVQRRSHQQADTIRGLEARLAELETPLRDQLAAAIQAATCPGECDSKAYCEHGRFQPTVWDDNGQPVEVGISGPPERIAALIAGALAEAADAVTAEHHVVNGATYLCHADDHYCPNGSA